MTLEAFQTHLCVVFPLPPPSFPPSTTPVKVVENVARLYQHGELATQDEEGWEPCEVLLIGPSPPSLPPSLPLPLPFFLTPLSSLPPSFPPSLPPFLPPSGDHLANVYARSPRVKKEFPDYHHHLRAAVGMARQMQVHGTPSLPPSLLSPPTQPSSG